MRRISTALLVTGALVLGACGGDDEPAEQATDEPADESDEDATNEPADEPDEPADEPAEPTDDEPADAPSGAGSGTATLTLDNGETFEFSILCTLEPQEAAGSEILFTAVSYDDPGLDITQFGGEGSGTVTDIASVSVYDGNYDVLWEANSTYETFGGTLDLSLDGSTISGVGEFFVGGDPIANPDPVPGTVEARCG